MSNTKIVIDKEQILDIIKSQSINHANMLFQIKKIISEATEIQIDQSIEDAAKEYSETNYFGLEEHDEGGYLGINEKEFANKLIDFATSQQIIEQLRVKEKDKECKHCGKIRNKHTVIGMCLDRMKHFEI